MKGLLQLSGETGFIGEKSIQPMRFDSDNLSAA